MKGQEMTGTRKVWMEKVWNDDRQGKRRGKIEAPTRSWQKSG